MSANATRALHGRQIKKAQGRTIGGRGARP